MKIYDIETGYSGENILVFAENLKACKMITQISENG